METAEEGRSLSEVRADPGGESDEDDEFRPGAGVTKREITAEVLAPADPAASGLHGEMNGGPVADSKAREPSAEVQGAPVVPVPTGSFRDLFSQATGADMLLMGIGSVCAMITGVSIPIADVLIGRVLDALNEDSEDAFKTAVADICIAFAVLAGINGVTGFTQVYCWSIAGARQTQRFRVRYVEAILRQEVGWFDTQGASEMSTRVDEICGKIDDGLARAMTSVQFFFSFCVAFYLSPVLAAVLLATIPLIAASSVVLMNAIEEATTKTLDQYSAAGGVATEAFGAIRTVTALNVQPEIIHKYQTLLLQAMNVGLTKGAKLGACFGCIFLIFLSTSGLGFWYGAVLIANDRDSGCTDNCVSGGTIVATFFVLIIGTLALGEVAVPLSAVLSARAAVVPVMEVLQRASAIDGLASTGLVPGKDSEGRIQLQDVVFAYPSRPDALVCKGYNISIEPGETVAFVGKSGAGKSTIMNLLLRFYDPQSGSITLDGHATTALNIGYLRSQLGYVGQEPVLFAGTVADNIAYGIPATLLRSLSPEEVRTRVVEAATFANAHTFILGFPDGYDTDVGSNGVAMSGGQKQRIAIARALIKKPAVLLLDEATSALDATSEQVVQEAIDKLQQSHAQTTIVIAHRLSTIRNADKIAVISDGVVSELGTHDELFSRGGVYTELVRLQMNSADEHTARPASSQSLASSDDVTIDKLDPEKEVESVSYLRAATSNAAPTSAAESSELQKRVWQALRPYRSWMLLALAGSVIFGGMFPVWGYVMGITYSAFYLDDTSEIRRRAGEAALYFFLLGIASFVGAFLQFFSVAQTGERVSKQLRGDLFTSLIRREIAYFDLEDNGVGAVTKRLSDDSRIMHKATGEAVAKQMQAACTFVLSVVIGFTASWKLSLVLFAVFPLTLAAAAVDAQDHVGSGAQEGTQSSASASSGAVISSALTNIRTIFAFSMQANTLDRFAALTHENYLASNSHFVFSGVSKAGNLFVNIGSYGLFFWYGSTLVLAGEITFEQMMIAIMCNIFAMFGLGTAVADLGDQKSGLQAAKRIFNAIDEGKRSVIDGLSTTGLVPVQRSSGRIELRNVQFSYPSRPNVQVCKSYSLVIEPGEVVALVGPSGSGKSTIMALLLRFYDADAGELLLDGCNVKDLNVRWLRSQIGYVGQEPVLFSGSVRDNIKKGLASVAISTPVDAQPEYSSDVENAISSEDVEPEVIDAARTSNAHPFIAEFPHGYNTDVGEGSLMVSGGQKQRIAIARALIKKPAVLLLDEATSALDATSEQVVQEAIDKLQQSHAQTTIVIAHRLSTIRNAHKIAVINQGCVVELGSHDELVQKEGLYFQLWTKQNASRK